MLTEGKSIDNGEEHRKAEKQNKVQNILKNYFTKVHGQM